MNKHQVKKSGIFFFLWLLVIFLPFNFPVLMAASQVQTREEHEFAERIERTDTLVAADLATEVVGELPDGRRIYYERVEEEISSTPFAAHSTRGTSEGSLTWQGIYATPVIRIEGLGYVYCIEPDKNAPNGQVYDNGTQIHDQGLTALLQAGFPSYQGNLTKHEAYLRTFVALNAYLGTFNRARIEAYGDKYINTLLEKADKQVKKQPYIKIHEPQDITSSYNQEKQRNETELYYLTGTAGNFWLENVPEGFSVIDEKETQVEQLPIGSKFRFVNHDVKLEDAFQFKVMTDLKIPEPMRYRATGVQDLVVLEANRAVLPIESWAHFYPATFSDDEKVILARQTKANMQQNKKISAVTLAKTGNDSTAFMQASAIYFLSLIFVISSYLVRRDEVKR